jgi:hypothetical protein
MDLLFLPLMLLLLLPLVMMMMMLLRLQQERRQMGFRQEGLPPFILLLLSAPQFRRRSWSQISVFGSSFDAGKSMRFG